MPRGRSTFSKRQKEQARQQRQRDKALRRNERKQAKPDRPSDDLAELHEHAAAQAALFHVGQEQASMGDEPAIAPGEEKNP
jgi:hypothetical protein